MNNIHIKRYIPKGEDGFTIPSLDSSIPVTTLLLHSLTELSLGTLLTAYKFHAYSNEGGILYIFRLVSYFLLSLFIPFKPTLIAYTPENEEQINK